MRVVGLLLWPILKFIDEIGTRLCWMIELDKAKEFNISTFTRIAQLMQSSLIGHIFSFGTAAVIARALTFITIAHTARMLGQEAFGLFNFGTSVLAYGTILVGPGLLVWGSRTVSQNTQQAGHYLILINSLQLVLAILAYLIFWLTASFFLGENEQSIVMVAGIGLFGIALSVEWVGRALEQFKLMGLALILNNLVVLLATLALVKLPADMYIALLLIPIGQAAGAVVLFFMLWRKGLLSFKRIEWRYAGIIVRAAIPLSVSAAMVTIMHYANNFILQFYHGSAALGLFSAPYRLVEILTSVPVLISIVFLPRLSRHFVSDLARARKEMHWCVYLTLSLACWPVATMLAEAPSIIQVTYGNQFVSAASLLQVLSLAVFFNFVIVAYTTGLIAAGQDRAYFWGIFTAMLLSVIGGMLLVPSLGVWGAVLIVAILDLASWLVVLPAYRRVVGAFSLTEWIRPVVCGMGLSLWLYLSQNLGMLFIARLGIGSIMYGICVMPWSKMRPWLQSYFVNY